MVNFGLVENWGGGGERRDIRSKGQQLLHLFTVFVVAKLFYKTPTSSANMDESCRSQVIVKVYCDIRYQEVCL